MATDTRKVLGQLAPLGQILSALYTVPALTSAVISSIVICNRATWDARFRVAIAVAGAAEDGKQYIYYDHIIPANKTFIATIGMTLAAADVVRVYSDSDYLSYNLFGQETA